jgi:hypothetical protein
VISDKNQKVLAYPHPEWTSILKYLYPPRVDRGDKSQDYENYDDYTLFKIFNNIVIPLISARTVMRHKK